MHSRRKGTLQQQKASSTICLAMSLWQAEELAIFASFQLLLLSKARSSSMIHPNVPLLQCSRPDSNAALVVVIRL